MLAGSEEDLQNLTDSLECRLSIIFRNGNKSYNKSKILVNGEAETPQIKMCGIAIEHVSNFKYLGATLSNNATSKKEIRIRLATAIEVMVKLESILRRKEINFKLYKSLVILTLLYGCETWTLYEESKKNVPLRK